MEEEIICNRWKDLDGRNQEKKDNRQERERDGRGNHYRS
jgi:hypothetical protein